MAARAVDLRGLSCPLPALRAGEAIKTAAPGEELVILLDRGVAESNVGRAAGRLGWMVRETALLEGGMAVSLTLRRRG